MQRREFSARLFTATFALTLCRGAAAQGAPIASTQYVRLNQPAPVSGGGKIEVVEFFWYGCPHCNAFEPLLDAWIKKLPPDVVFRRVPVDFRAPMVLHQKVFYALEAMGQVEAMHRKVFYAIHHQHRPLDKEADI